MGSVGQSEMLINKYVCTMWAGGGTGRKCVDGIRNMAGYIDFGVEEEGGQLL